MWSEIRKFTGRALGRLYQMSRYGERHWILDLYICPPNIEVKDKHIKPFRKAGNFWNNVNASVYWSTKNIKLGGVPMRIELHVGLLCRSYFLTLKKKNNSKWIRSQMWRYSDATHSNFWTCSITLVNAKIWNDNSLEIGMGIY